MPANFPQGPISELAAAQIIQQSQDKAYRAAALGEQLGIKNVLGSKQAALNDTIKQTQAEQKDSVVKFSSAGLGALLNGKLAAQGATNKPIRQLKDEADAAFAKRMDVHNGLKAAATATANGGNMPRLVDGSAEAISQAMGPQADINAAKIDSKAQDLAETAAKQLMDGFKGSKEQAYKAKDQGNDFIKAIFDRAKQTADKIFG